MNVEDVFGKAAYTDCAKGWVTICKQAWNVKNLVAQMKHGLEDMTRDEVIQNLSEALWIVSTAFDIEYKTRYAQDIPVQED